VPEAKVEVFAGDLATATATEALLKLFPEVDILVNTWEFMSPSFSMTFATRIGANNLRGQRLTACA